MFYEEGPANWRRCHPQAGGPGLYKQTNCANHEKQANEQHHSMAFASGPVFRFLPRVLALIFLPDGRELSGRRNKPYTLQVAFDHGDLSGQQKAMTPSEHSTTMSCLSGLPRDLFLAPVSTMIPAQCSLSLVLAEKAVTDLRF